MRGVDLMIGILVVRDANAHVDVSHVLFFFFQAEDGIRDRTVTGVQTCALPIYLDPRAIGLARRPQRGSRSAKVRRPRSRSEERRVGKECRSRWAPDHEKKKSEWVSVGTRVDS